MHKPSRALLWITGSQGMLGRRLCTLCSLLKVPHVATTHSDLDLTQGELVSDFVRTQKITHVINCAAYTAVDAAEKEQERAYLVNAIAPHHLAVAARRHGGAWLLHVSTDYVFDGRATNSYMEERACRPLNVYGASKRAGEVKVLQEHTKTCVVRTSWLFDAHGKNFVTRLIPLMQSEKHLRVVMDQFGSPTSCADLSLALLELMQRGATGIYHYSNAGETTWYHFAHTIWDKIRGRVWPLALETIVPITSREYPGDALRPACTPLNCTKISQLLGASPRPWEIALEDVLSEYVSSGASQ